MYWHGKLFELELKHDNTKKAKMKQKIPAKIALHNINNVMEVCVLISFISVPVKEHFCLDFKLGFIYIRTHSRFQNVRIFLNVDFFWIVNFDDYDTVID